MPARSVHTEMEYIVSYLFVFCFKISLLSVLAFCFQTILPFVLFCVLFLSQFTVYSYIRYPGQFTACSYIRYPGQFTVPVVFCLHVSFLLVFFVICFQIILLSSVLCFCDCDTRQSILYSAGLVSIFDDFTRYSVIVASQRRQSQQKLERPVITMIRVSRIYNK